jgi:hypothetical protein
MSEDADHPMEALYDKAGEIAERHFRAALEEGGAVDYLVAVMMIEIAVNAAADATSPEDVLRLLKDLAQQIEQDIAQGDK